MSARFATPLQVERRNHQWMLTAELIFVSEVLGRLVVVPAGFITDFASVPRLPFAYWVAGDTAHDAAVVHDFLYKSGGTTRAQADAVFREAMAVIGEPWWRRNLMWAGVRLFGWTAYSDRSQQGGSR